MKSLLRLTTLTTLAGSLLLGCGGLEDSVGEADTAEGAIDLCVYGADATMTVGLAPNLQYGSVVSNGITHTNDCQTSFVADVSVTPGYALPFTLYGGFDDEATPLTATNCALASNYLVITKRRINHFLGTTTPWSTVSVQSVQGEWTTGPDVNPHCFLGGAVYIPGAAVPPGNSDVYRVRTRPRLDGAFRQARVNWD